MTITLDAQALRTQIEKLLIDFPELAEDEELRADMLEGSTDINWILGKLVDQELEADCHAETIAVMLAKLGGRKKRFENKCDALRKLIADILDRAGLDKWKLPQATLSVRKLAPKPIVTDETLLPDELCRFKRSPDMAAIKEQIDLGMSVAGVVMSNGSTSLTVRRT